MIRATTEGEIDFDPTRLSGFLADLFGADGSRYAIRRISGGQSNPSYFLDYGPHSLVLRKRPLGPVLPGAHAIDREFRVMSALAPTDVPVPKPVVLHEDPELIGTPFYLMERVEGRIFTDTALADLPLEERKAIWMSVAETMAAMHGVRPEAVGLGDYGKAGSYFERQLGRWDRQYRGSPSAPVPEIEALFAWLSAHRPAEDGRVALCHGDFRLGNLVFHPAQPRVVAILDWELSTLGHPLADLGFCCMAWHTAPDEYGGLLGLDLASRGLPTEAEFVGRYMEASRERMDLLPFHRAFALYRFAVIFVGIADRARTGTAADPEAAKLAPLAARFARRGLEIAAGQPHAIAVARG